MTRVHGLLVLPLALAACEPGAAPARDQWVVVIGTDAPVPQLADRLVVDVVDDAGNLACSGCSRQLAVGSPDDWPVSFGVMATGNDALFVRATLFRADHLGFDGAPVGDAHLEAVGALPPASGVTKVTMNLRMKCFGAPADVVADRSCDAPVAVLGESDVVEPSTWPEAARVDCAEAAPVGTVCVPGGVFLLGSVDGFGDDELPERLVRVSPFAMDVDEVTVGVVKQLFAEGKISREPQEPDTDPMGIKFACRYSSASTANDALAVNCVDHALAQAICAARDMRLPTEAQWEWAAGNLERETTYPWGEEDDLCDLAVVGRGRFATEVMFPEPDNCRGVAGEEGVPWGHVPGGDEDDVTELGIRNLGGNVSEWIEDDSAGYNDACWQPTLTLLQDPVCRDAGDIVVNRGGGWNGYPLQARVFERNRIERSKTPTSTGVRCVLPMSAQ